MKRSTCRMSLSLGSSIMPMQFTICDYEQTPWMPLNLYELLDAIIFLLLMLILVFWKSTNCDSLFYPSQKKSQCPGNSSRIVSVKILPFAAAIHRSSDLFVLETARLPLWIKDWKINYLNVPCKITACRWQNGWLEDHLFILGREDPFSWATAMLALGREG